MKKLFLFIGLVSINFIFAQQNEIDITPNNSWLKAGITAEYQLEMLAIFLHLIWV
ncbi:MAG TPA: hypothetical protein PK218_02205 [Flavobacterium sp.]|nr:hypothetical protein [Flavobacterium sp.]